MSEDFDLASYYDDYGEREWDRLERDFYHRLEWEETLYFLKQHLPTTGHVLDVGGGAGRYSVWLAQQGYTVTLVDPSRRQVELTTTKAAEHGVDNQIMAEVGDVRNLQQDSAKFDATLCLGGPLSHVLAEEERREAVTELKRVTVHSGSVFVSVMGRLAALQTITRFSGKLPPEEDETELLPRLVRTGDYDTELLNAFDRDPTGPPMHLFRAAELEHLLEQAGLTIETVTGLESIVSQRRDDFDELTDEHRDAIKEAVSALRGDRMAADLSGHILAVTWA